ncbi:TlpA disulfide reductase family protein [Algibacter sp. L4_22]|uniref:TlpA family protein disulfide reductase n=1 Tax=Algibacter sp. L4_22 TaxID=2942477 RepID=UPI00201B853D|nr:TlpA disulfide reductase family protein [Algibacter sp. L4_22]MCL5128040.1 TlpA family protein disulfide reductase [Algibacter sp. L4_22]
MNKGTYLLLALAITACNKNTNRDYAIITGKISNNTASALTIVSGDSFNSKHSINISSDGHFIDTLTTDNANYSLYIDRQPLQLNVKPGDSININYDAKDIFNTVKISGKGSEISNYLFGKKQIFAKHLGSPNETFSKNEADYKALLQRIIKDQELELVNTEGIPADYVSNEKRNINYDYYNWLLRYERAHIYFTKEQDFKVSEDFLNEMNDLDYNNENDFNFSNSYKDIVALHYTDKSEKKAKQDVIANDVAFIETVSAIENETIKNKLLFDFTNKFLESSSNAKILYTLYSENSTNEENNEIIDKKYKRIAGLVAGNVSPKFIDYKNHEGGTTSLDDLKGKFVYIDVWATWCGPCVKEIPSLKKVEEQYHGKNIEFVSISIDKASDFNKWKKTVTDKDLKGVQLFADNNWDSNFVKDYQIKGIPRFILIDPEGNIVETNAPRPSDSRLITLFNSLNI